MDRTCVPYMGTARPDCKGVAQIGRFNVQSVGVGRVFAIYTQKIATSQLKRGARTPS
jgi:hypothetical protein